MRRAIFLCALIWIGGMGSLGAETVYVRSAHHEGQGWSFRVGAACWAVTAAHVIDERAGVIAVGSLGAQGQATAIFRHPTLDVAAFELAGMPLQLCSGSSLGDRDDTSVLDRLQYQRGEIFMEHRSGDTGRTTGVSYGLEPVALRLVGTSHTEPTFSARVVGGRADQIKSSDSGGPVRFRGSSFGDEGLPVGIVYRVVGDAVLIVRMDAVRQFVESLSTRSGGAVPRMVAPFSIVSFSGATDDTQCGPLNVVNIAASCGWRVRRTASNRVSIVVGLGDTLQRITGVHVGFSARGSLRGIELATSADVPPNAEWQGERYCAIPPSASALTCTLGERSARSVRIIFDATAFELRELRVLGPSE